MSVTPAKVPKMQCSGVSVHQSRQARSVLSLYAFASEDRLADMVLGLLEDELNAGKAKLA